jgi:hypothetical protein
VLNNRTAGLYWTQCGNGSKFLAALLKITTMLLNLKCSQWLLLLLKPHGSPTRYNTNNKIKTVIFQNKGMQWCSLLRSCATSWKVAGLIPDGFMVIFHLLEPSGHTVALESTQNRNEQQRYLLGGKGGQWAGLTTLSPSCADCLKIWGASTTWIPTREYFLYLLHFPNNP